MKKFLPWIILGAILVLGIFYYNGLVSSIQNVNKAWSNVENQYQRRSDLIPNLVNTVKGAADFEKSTLEAVMTARASATSIKIDPNNITPEKLAEFQKAQAQVSGALGRLLAVAENYPQLQAVKAFNELQAQLEGTENRINEARRQFNDATADYNISRAKFPRVILANLFGFKERAYFQADEGTEKVPTVKF